MFAKGRKPVGTGQQPRRTEVGGVAEAENFAGFDGHHEIGGFAAALEVVARRIGPATGKLALDKEYFDAVTSIKNNLKTLESQRENVKLAREVMENTQNNYYNGLASLTDLLDSEQALTESQNNYNTALLAYKLAEVQLIKSGSIVKATTTQQAK